MSMLLARDESCSNSRLMSQSMLSESSRRHACVEKNGNARADTDLLRIAPDRHGGGGGRPGGRENVTAIPISVYGYHNICMYSALRPDSVVMNTLLTSRSSQQ